MLAAEDHNHNIFGFCRQMNDPIRRYVGRLPQQFLIIFMTFSTSRNFGKFQRGMLPEIILDLLLGDAVEPLLRAALDDVGVSEGRGRSAAKGRGGCSRP